VAAGRRSGSQPRYGEVRLLDELLSLEDLVPDGLLGLDEVLSLDVG